jgi:hypothetical protein
MNMKRLLTLLFVFAFAFLLSSCSIFRPTKKYLIGTWKPEKIEKFDMPISKPGQGESKSSTAVVISSPRSEKLMNNLIEAELKSTLTFKKDKTMIKDYSGHLIQANWKLEHHKTRLVTDSKSEKTDMNFNILEIDNTRAIVTQSSRYGGMKITLKKIKK